MTRTKVKMCGLSRPEDILIANELQPDYIGFVFFPKSHRNVSPEQAAQLKALLDPAIPAVGVFVDAEAEFIADLMKRRIIDIAQLHGHEDNDFISRLRTMTGKPIFQAFKIRTPEDAERAERSEADFVLLDNGKGTGRCFDWSLIQNIQRPFFLAGGLDTDNISDAIVQIHPYAVDVSSGIETEHIKDECKMRMFMKNVRLANERS